MQVIGTSKLVHVMWYAVIIGAVFFNSLVSGESDLPQACCTECSCKVTQSGQCSWQFQEECDHVGCLHLDWADETSLVDLVVSARKIPNAANSTDPIRLDISEFDVSRYVHLETWQLQPVGTEETYLSRTSRVRVCVARNTDYVVTFAFRELKYLRDLEVKVEDPFGVSGVIEREVVPNSVTLFRLPEDPRVKWAGIEMTLHDLQLDTQRGEYLLVGAGSPSDFRARFVTQVRHPFYVANASAYLELVSYQPRTLRIAWERKSGKAPLPLEPTDTLNAVLVCFFNDTLAQKEFEEKKDMEEAFPTFREALAKFAVDRTQKKYDCTKSSVMFLGNPTPIQTEQALSILLLLRCEDRTFKYQELRKLMDEFTDADGNRTLTYKVGLCPSAPSPPLREKEIWSKLIYSLAPAFALGMLFVWAWKNKVFHPKCSPEKVKEVVVDLETPAVPVEPNNYEPTQTIPKICLVTGEGRRQTLLQGSPQEAPDDGPSETAVEMRDIPSTSRESDALVQVLHNRSHKRRPSLQPFMPQKEDEPQKSQGEESDHLYDCVSSGKDIGETKL